MKVGGKRGPGATGGAGGSSGPSGVKGAFIKRVEATGRVEANAAVERASVAGTSNVAPSTEVLEALELVKMYQEGRLGDEAEATGKLVESILRRKKFKFGKKSNDQIAKRIAEVIGEDPNLQKFLKRIWSHREA